MRRSSCQYFTEFPNLGRFAHHDPGRPSLEITLLSLVMFVAQFEAQVALTASQEAASVQIFTLTSRWAPAALLLNRRTEAAGS
jgi:hypothetical protein